MDIKKLTAVFGVSVAGIVVCLIMTIVTAVQQSHEKQEAASRPVAVPAVGQ